MSFNCSGKFSSVKNWEELNGSIYNIRKRGHLKTVCFQNTVLTKGKKKKKNSVRRDGVTGEK